MPSNIRSTRRPPRSEVQRQSILDAASLLFIEKGFGGTNINDIADAVGVTRTALYYYFPSKEAMLESLTKDVTERASELTAEVSRRAELPADQALRELILRQASLVLAHPLQFRVAERSESSLPEAQRHAAQAARRAVRDGFVSVIRRGIAEGVFPAVDADVAAFSIIGMCNWCAWWFDSRRGEPVEPVAELIATFGLRMLRTPDAPGTATRGNARAARADATDVGYALARAREALDLLENSLASTP